MTNCKQLVQTAFKGLVGEIPQVYADFVHYYGEERVDIQITCSSDSHTYPFPFNFEGYKDFLVKYNIRHLIENSRANITGINAFSRVRLVSIIDNILTDTLIVDENTLNDLLLINKLIQNYYSFRGQIIVYFPEVTIVNDNDKTHLIKDLYTRIILEYNGTICGDPYFTRSTFTPEEWNCNYIHSHVNGGPFSGNRTDAWGHCCLGRGPLATTIPALRVDSNLNMWPLFCLELDRYVGVESLKGGPYKRFEELGNRSLNSPIYIITPRLDERVDVSVPNHIESINLLLSGFLNYLIKSRVLQFNYYNREYNIAHSMVEYTQLIVNTFIKYYNEVYTKLNIPIDNRVTFQKLIENKILAYAKIENQKIRYAMSGSNTVRNHRTDSLFNFKGNPVYITVPDFTTNNNGLVLLFTIPIYKKLLNLLLTFINNGTAIEHIKQTNGYIGQTFITI